MDVLNEQLAQLKLMNSRPLSPKSSSSSNIQSASSTISDLNLGGQHKNPVHHKNIGPAVPPKPIKKNLAQIQNGNAIYSKQFPNDSFKSSNNAAIVSGLPPIPPPLPPFHYQQQHVTSATLATSASPAMLNKTHNNSPRSLYSNMEMTLDNPTILNQQLEALEHHKKQLEMKGMLPISSASSSAAASPLPTSSIVASAKKSLNAIINKSNSLNDTTNISTSTLSSNNINNNNNNNNNKMHLYSNTSSLLNTNKSVKIPPSLQSISSSQSVSPAESSPSAISANSSASSSSSSGLPLNLSLKRTSDIVYSNILHQHNSLSNNHPSSSSSASSSSLPGFSVSGLPNQVYSNVNYNSGIGELPPPPPVELPCNLNLSNQHSSLALDYSHQINDDDLPPPPSPVSSSYSELRRATDNFPQMPVYPLPSIYDNGGRSSISSAIDPLSGATDQQTYVNTSFQNDYSTYGPISQISSSPNSDCYGYGSLSKDSSTYESIYEPINPRPPSQLSSRSNYSLYTSYVNGIQSGGPGTPLVGPSKVMGCVNGRLPTNKEAEVETLTDLLVHSMDAASDIDSFGVCVKCGERVVGENSGCTAMEQIYHIACFTCAICQINLQGKPFYALDGKPHCEEDYLNTLEKCSVCMKPILERILRATGKPYHPQCFTCVVCGNSLDGIPFTVDATNQNYCIEDFHKKFAPRCCVCKQPIMPEPGQEETVRVVALDRSFHFECYKCEDCGLLLSSEAEGRGCYPLDDHVLCKSCNAKRVQALTNCMTTDL